METNDVRKIHGLVIAREKMVTVVETPTWLDDEGSYHQWCKRFPLCAQGWFSEQNPASSCIFLPAQCCLSLVMKKCQTDPG
jgi:hypothetical protein